jgi:isopenicillin N synthase-like dioxygenase
MSEIHTATGVRRVSAETAGLEAKRLAFTEIPVIDFAPMREGDLAARRRVAAALREACIGVGFFYLVDHGVAQALIDRTFAQAKRFFGQPLDAKMAIHIKKSKHHRGYVPLLEENTDPTARGDLHEALDISLEVPADDPDVLAGKSFYGPNAWPDGLPGFRAAMDEYYWAMIACGRSVFAAFALALDLPEAFFDACITKPMGSLRLLHYPPQTGPIDEKQIGTGAHSDYECFTMLAQDGIGGLQVLNSAGEWIHAPPVPGAFVVNVGDMMARWTNGLFASTVHRAINRSGRERYSIPFFYGPNYDTAIACLSSCQGPDNPARYPAIAAGDYLIERFNQTFAYRKA